jgi:carbon-monoxide dehydrogenase large subunit
MVTTEQPRRTLRPEARVGVIGERARRVEDVRLLRGDGVFIDDIDVPNCLHAAIVRSPHAHAKIESIDVRPALALDGVVAAYTFNDLGNLARTLPLLIPNEALTHPKTQTPLARDHVVYAGQPVAMVIASTRYVAEDATELVAVDYEPLPPAIDLDQALAGINLVHDDVPRNRAAYLVQTKGDVEAALATSPHVIERKISVERSAATPLETRGVIAVPERSGRLLLHDTTQAPSTIRAGLSTLLGLAEHDVDVVAPDVGGGFGVKLPVFYPEEVLIPMAARRLGRPVKWVEDRREHFLASNHERGQLHRVRVGVNDDGTIAALADEFIHDSGSFCPYGIIVAIVTASRLPGPYKIPAYSSELHVVYTNTAPVSPYRGAGIPQAAFVMERCIDLIARELAIDRVEVRRRNFLHPSDFPYQVGLRDDDGTMTTYDNGNYEETLTLALERLSESIEEERAGAAERKRRVGVGYAVYVEGTGQGPYEGARVHVETTGHVVVSTGIATQGQSHHTTLAQIAAHVLGVRLEDIVVRTGDTREFKWATGTFAARVAVVVGNAVANAAATVREKALDIASRVLEVAPKDLLIEDGIVRVADAPERSVPLRQLAILANPLRYAFSEDALAATEFGGDTPLLRPVSEDPPGLEATAYFSPERGTFASGAHAVVVEVDPETAEVRILRYVVAHDCGQMINPTIVEGQLHGGLAQGIGGALYERMAYNEDGQLMNANFMDFLMPYATEVPPFEIEHADVLSLLNPLGIKGVGEAGTIAPAAAIIGAIEDAVGIEILEAPLTPQRLFELLQESRPAKAVA